MERSSPAPGDGPEFEPEIAGQEPAGPEPPEPEDAQRRELAASITRRSQDIVARWLEQVRADARAADVPLTDLRDGIHEYLERLADLLKGADSLEAAGGSAWHDVAREHAGTRVRLGFDVSQLFHELVVLRRITTEVLREEGQLSNGRQADRLVHIIDGAINASIKSYVEFRDADARRTEAEHLGFLTHELRNPLSVAAMAVGHLRNPRLALEHRGQLHDILDRSIDRIRRMIDDALLSGRLQAHEVDAHPVDTTVGALIGDSLELFHRAAHEKGLDLRTTFDPAMPIHADVSLTMSALQNLVDNAIKYTDAGGVTLDVESGDRGVSVHVRDHCDGLSAEKLHVIFEPFTRAHGKKSGSGLGLAIAKRAIEAQGGTIHAESSVASGCHFWFVLPRPSANRRRS